MKLIKIVLTFTLIYSNCHANDGLEKNCIEALSKTKYGKNTKLQLKKRFKNRINKLGVPYIFGIADIAIKQQIELQYNKNNNLHLNYRKQQIIYQYQFDF